MGSLTLEGFGDISSEEMSEFDLLMQLFYSIDVVVTVVARRPPPAKANMATACIAIFRMKLQRRTPSNSQLTTAPPDQDSQWQTSHIAANFFRAASASAYAFKDLSSQDDESAHQNLVGSNTHVDNLHNYVDSTLFHLSFKNA
ncbi:unnamed protein product [Toxocara canis]|uniref:Uncharacterized protein n=1 Tax=Toxocara canis TaxID=6265 RepID=A0A183TVM8_TOXCA|nr:unnamed protein product [Toxocara canis]